jgi:adenine deaminase
MTRDLADVAAGRRTADTVIVNGQWVNVYTGEILPGTSVAITGCRIAYCGPHRPELIGDRTHVVDAAGRFLVPGLLDAHVHIESSMLTVSGFAAAVLPHGTTSAFIDPHEIANVLGIRGVRWMADEALETPMQIYVQVPSCVPAAPGLETAGAAIGPANVREALAWEDVIGLGEVMNYPGVAGGDAKLHEEIAETLRARRIVGGHYASEDLGPTFFAYAASGPSDCHEGTRVEDAIARLRQGMYAILRQGSSEHNVAAQVKAVTEHGLDSRHVLLCTDDRHANSLVEDGHMDHVVRLAIQEGVPPVTAVRMATLNTAEHFGVSGDVGSIGPGRYADILIVSDLPAFQIDVVMAAGESVANHGRLTVAMPAYVYPQEACRSVHLPNTLTAEDFAIPCEPGDSTAACRVIQIVAGQVITRASIVDVRVTDGRIAPDPSTGICHLAVIERHSGDGGIGRGLVQGYGIRAPFALASTVAHDSHNLLVMGNDRALMAAAAARVSDLQGGLCLMDRDGIVADLPLPVAGLMSSESADRVAARAGALQQGLADLGCEIEDALMSFLFLALPVIPELRLTDRGIVDVGSFAIVPLVPDEDNREDEER